MTYDVHWWRGLRSKQGRKAWTTWVVSGIATPRRCRGEGPNSCDVQERLPPSRRAPNMGTSRVQCQHYRRQASAGACGVQCDGVIGCDLSNQGDKVGMTTSTMPHGDHHLKCKVGSLMLACRSRIRDLGGRFPRTRHKHIGPKPSRASLSRLDSMHGWLAAVPSSCKSV